MKTLSCASWGMRAGEAPARLDGARSGRRLIDIRIRRDVVAARADVSRGDHVAREFPLDLHVELLHPRRLEIQIDRAEAARRDPAEQSTAPTAAAAARRARTGSARRPAACRC